MRPAALLLILSLLTVAEPVLAQEAGRDTITIAPGMFGSKLTFDGRDVTPTSRLRPIMANVPDTDREKMLDQAETQFVWSNSLAIPGAVIGGLGFGGGNTAAGVIGTVAMLAGIAISIAASGTKDSAVRRYNAQITGRPVVADAPKAPPDSSHWKQAPALYGR